MDFAEQLNAKKNLRVIDFANKFVETIKPVLIGSAEKGYGAFRYTIDTDSPEEKEKLQLYTNPLFVEHLNKNLDGVKVRYEKEFIENLFFKSRGWYKHHLIFNW